MNIFLWVKCKKTVGLIILNRKFDYFPCPLWERGINFLTIKQLLKRKIFYINIGGNKGNTIMALINQILNESLNLAERTTRYVKACGKRSILETKPNLTSNLKGLKYTHNLTTDCVQLSCNSPIRAENIKLTNIKNIHGIPSDIGTLAFLYGKPIARYEYSISKPLASARVNRYPKSWIDTNGNIKNSLYIDYIATEGIAEGAGYGRLMIQRLYQESLRKGCGGRLSLHSSFGSHGFYDKLGFEVGERTIQKKYILQKQLEEKMQNLLANKKAGLKVEDSEIIDIKQQLDKINIELSNHVPCESGFLFFTPTEQNLKKLFKN